MGSVLALPATRISGSCHPEADICDQCYIFFNQSKYGKRNADTIADIAGIDGSNDSGDDSGDDGNDDDDNDDIIPPVADMMEAAEELVLAVAKDAREM